MRPAAILLAGALLAASLAASACGSKEGGVAGAPAAQPAPRTATKLVDVAAASGIDFRHGAFRWETTRDVVPMMGTGLCWLDADGDERLDLFVVNSYAEQEAARWREAGGLPTTALYRNLGDGRFEEVGEESGASYPVRGTGCVAADLDTDGDTDLYVTTATDNLLLVNDGAGRFAEGAKEAGVSAYGWSSGAAVGDVNGDRRPDLVVAGYADLNNRVPTAKGGFPGTFLGVRDQLFLNEGGDDGNVGFREVGAEAGLEVTSFAHGLGAVLTDVDLDGDLDLYLANDTEPNRLYRNVRWPGGPDADPAGLGFRFEEMGARAGVADPNAGMGVASADWDSDRLPDLFVTNLREQGHGVYRNASETPGSAPAFTDEEETFGPELATASGWGVSFADLDLDTDLDIVLANGHVPLLDLEDDAERLQSFENRTAQGDAGVFADWSTHVGMDDLGALNARGSAVADYDSDGDPDVAIAVVGGPLILLENQGEGGAWLEVALAQFAPGARVTVTLPDGKRLVREAQAGSSYLSSEDPRLHFGLGEWDAGRAASVEVRWPGGATTRVADVAANQVLRVEPPGND